MNEKQNLINQLSFRLATCDDLNLQKVKDILTMELYNYSISKITETALSTGNRRVTEELMHYFYLGKLGSNKTEGTIHQYTRVVNQLCSMVKKELNMITSEDVQYFLVMYKKIFHIKDSTMENKRLYLSSVFSYLYKHKKIAENPMTLIESINYKKCVKTPLTDEEIEHIRIACGMDKRKIAIVDFFLNTGVRVTELCNIRLSDVDFSKQRCKVLGKGNKERYVYFDGKCKVRLQEYLKTRKDINNNNVYNIETRLFASNDVNCKPMHKSGISTIIKDIGRISGVVRLHCHLFRATFATNLAKRGVDVNVIARLLGHANLNTIPRYVLLSDEQLDLKLKEVGVA